MLAIESPLPLFVGRDGLPLDAGYIYFGTVNLNPVTSPVTVYWDAAGTQPVAQPVRTSRGLIVRSGTPAKVYASGNFSLLVKDSAGAQVVYERNSSEWQVSAYVDELRADLASTSDAAKGDALIGVKSPLTGSVARTQHSKNQDSLSVKDFGAVGDGATDDTAAIIAAIAAAKPTLPGNPWDLNGTAGGTVIFPAGKYKVSSTIVVPAWVNLKGAGKSATLIVASGNPGEVVSMGLPGLAPANDPLQSFHCSVSGMTIYGSNLNTIGLAIYASFWMTSDIEVTNCNYHGIYLKTSYTGKAYNTYSFYNATSSGYAGIMMDGVSAGLGANDVSFIGGSIGNCYDSVRIEQCNGAVFCGMSIQSSKRMGFNLQSGAVGLVIRDCYFESNAETVAGSTIYGSLAYAKIDGNYFAGFGINETKYIAGSSFTGASITNNLFGSSGGGSYIVGLVNEAAGSCTFIRNIIIGNAGENDSVPLFSPALKVFVDAALYTVDTATLNRVDHLTQYAYQVSGIKSYLVTVTPSTSGTITLDPTANTAVYTKIDKLVHVQGRVLVTSVASPVGTSIKLSLPFAIATLPQSSGKIGGTLVDSGTTVRAFTGDETNSYINVILTAASVTAGMYYSFSFSYLSV